MLEWLVMSGATVGATELGKAVFEQGLRLGRTAAEDYVKDFFKGCLKEGVAAAKPEVAKKAVAGALQAFLLLVTDELEDQELSKADIRDRYDAVLIQFVKDESVKPILGQAFEKNCSAIDSAALVTLWEQSTLRGKPFPPMPDGFDWQRISTEYLKKVRRIVRETPELRSLLETALLEDIARNTANLNTQISPGFDVAKYRESLQSSYGYLKLSTIDTTDQQYRVKLWSMFIEQTVREDIRQTSEVLKTSEVSELESDRREYFQQLSRKVLSVVGALHETSPRAVILGDPGAGKSTLLQYLALEWVESQTLEVSVRLPLLIELREYAIAQTDSFLDFLHRGRGVDWQFDQQQLHQYLQEHSTLVMFDGLDEVFDRPTQAAITDDIIRFAQQYPQAQILITSRIIGYNPERLQHAGFRHFTIQSLDIDEIHAFIDRWYTLALGNDPDKPRLVTRLKDAIANSIAIQNLADNPLLLTMMAILNRRQELPRDRVSLYKQASELLLEKWDLEAKHGLKDPRWGKYPIEIDYRDKQFMLQKVAYFIQANEGGLERNSIHREDLENCLKSYLKNVKEAQNYPSITTLMIDQLRKRDSVLCHYGADIYGFVHRTFLEYFCAVEIVNRFEKQRTLTFEQLRDEVFGNHWQEETWHEVLRLICGMIDAKFTGDLLEFLMEVKFTRREFFVYGKSWKEGSSNLLFAVDCLLEVKSQVSISQTTARLVEKLKQEIDLDICTEHFELDLTITIMSSIATIGRSDSTTLDWLRTCFQSRNPHAREAVIRVISHTWKSLEVWNWLKSIVQEDEYQEVKLQAIRELAYRWRDDSQTFSLLIEFTQGSNLQKVRIEAIRNLSCFWKDDSKTFPLLKKIAQEDEDKEVRIVAIREVIRRWKDQFNLFDFLVSVAIRDPFRWVEYTQDNILIKLSTLFDTHPRLEALESIVALYPTDPRTSSLLHDRAINDPDEQLRVWAKEQLAQRSQE